MLSPRTRATDSAPMSLLPQEEGLGETVGRGLHLVGERDAESRTIAQQALELLGVLGVVMMRMSRMPARIRVDSG
ncbi:hypothetical protein HR12_48470 [Microbacterium sp. SUBG005]|nr:hypothetical protein HR12_48470 [Microbacterium sp. SUBG005]